MRKDGKQQHCINIFIFERQPRCIRPGKSTVKGKEKEHKMQHVASQNMEPNTEPNFRYSTVYYFKGRVYCGRSKGKTRKTEFKKSEATQSCNISNFMFLSSSKIRHR